MDLFLWFIVVLLFVGMITGAGFMFADFINNQYPNGRKINTEEPDKVLSLAFFEYFARFFYLGVLGIICTIIGLLLLPLGILFFPVIWTARKARNNNKVHKKPLVKFYTRQLGLCDTVCITCSDEHLASENVRIYSKFKFGLEDAEVIDFKRKGDIWIITVSDEDYKRFKK